METLSGTDERKQRMNDRDGGQRKDRDLIEPHRGNGSDGKCSMS